MNDKKGYKKKQIKVVNNSLESKYKFNSLIINNN